MAERFARAALRLTSADDPLNLIRLIPAKGAKKFSAVPPLCRTAFFFPMIATKDSIEPHSSDQLPASTRVYVQGELFPDVKVPMREIELSPTKTMNGGQEANAPVRVYDCSGPWGDPEFAGTSDEGLPTPRAKWIADRGDVAAYDGREVKPQDNGYLSGKHAEYASKAERNRLVEFPGLKGQRRRPLRASAGHPVTQLWYARQGIITPEMEYIAIRENLGRAKIAEMSQDIRRDDLDKQHAGSAQLQNEYTPGIFRRWPCRSCAGGSRFSSFCPSPGRI